TLSGPLATLNTVTMIREYSFYSRLKIENTGIDFANINDLKSMFVVFPFANLFALTLVGIPLAVVRVPRMREHQKRATEPSGDRPLVKLALTKWNRECPSPSVVRPLGHVTGDVRCCCCCPGSIARKFVALSVGTPCSPFGSVSVCACGTVSNRLPKGSTTGAD